MIDRPTVFVLGAGAHCSYDFPSGELLKTQVAEVVRSSYETRGEDCLNRLHDHKVVADIDHVSSSRCGVFAKALSQCAQSSIDAFLNANRHQPGFQEIGKAAIAQVLLKKEASATVGGDDDWITYLLQYLTRNYSPDEFIEKNKIAFITFNYDRFLETALVRKISSSFGLDDIASHHILRKIPIVHMYGSLGAYPEPPMMTSGGYGDLELPKDWIPASQGIRTIYDAERDTKVLASAQRLLDWSEKICLLGFGFHPENIELIELPKLTKGRFVAGSRYGLTDIEVARGLRPFGIDKPQLVNNQHWKCLDTLKNIDLF